MGAAPGDTCRSTLRPFASHRSVSSVSSDVFMSMLAPVFVPVFVPVPVSRFERVDLKTPDAGSKAIDTAAVRDSKPSSSSNSIRIGTPRASNSTLCRPRPLGPLNWDHRLRRPSSP